jgi:uncharacterized membrane-anchored protein
MASVTTQLRRRRPDTDQALTGTCRVERDPVLLLGRLRRGDVAVIDRMDLDRATALQLAAAGVAAVVNAAPTVSGRYPSLGASVLLDAGVTLLDDAGTDALSLLRDGQQVSIDGDAVRRGDQVVLTARRQDATSVTASLVQAEAGLATQMEVFAATSAEYLRREHAVLLEPGVVPVLPVLKDRDVLVVAPGPDHREQLRALAPFVREYRPAVVAVDTAADTVLALGFPLTVLVGDLAEVSDRALREASHVVVRLDREGSTPGLARVDRLGVTRETVSCGVRPSELALLLADDSGARTIVSAGAERTVAAMLDSGRTESAAAFVTRLRVGSRLLDATAVAQLHRPRVSGWLLALLLVVAVALLGAAAWLTPVGQQTMTTVQTELAQLVSTVTSGVS